MSRLSFILACLLTISAGACRRQPPLLNSLPSDAGLAVAVLEAIAAKDRGRLEALVLSEAEFRGLVWSELPAARPERNLPFSYVWGDLHQKSQLSLSSMLARHGGQHYVLERVTFASVTDYPSYRVHRDATFHVRNSAGESMPLRICGSMLEKAGDWKVFSYVVDE